MAKVKGDIVVDIEKCKGCELCVVACPQDTIALSDKINKKGYHYMVKIKDNCTGCENCALVCPDAVITVYRKTGKKKEKVATITNVQKDMTLEVN
ncbi:MAG: ferredoxin family protein [Ignavibacteria bacterium]|nr:ferredoxin family protein [Ignavibacteria bacterium]